MVRVVWFLAVIVMATFLSTTSVIGERILSGHTKVANSIAWSPDGTRLASASDDNTVRIWDIAEFSPKQPGFEAIFALAALAAAGLLYRRR